MALAMTMTIYLYILYIIKHLETNLKKLVNKSFLLTSKQNTFSKMFDCFSVSHLPILMMRLSMDKHLQTNICACCDD